MILSLRAKLVLSFMAVMVLTGAVAIVAGLRLISDRFVAEMQSKVKMDINTAREVYLAEVKDVEHAVRYTADRDFLRDGISRKDKRLLEMRLGKIKEKERLDMLTVVDGGGNAFLRVGSGVRAGDSQKQNPLVQRALQGRETCSATLIVPSSELQRHGSRLAEQAYIKFVPTPMAKKIAGTEESSGMAIAAVSPILDASGRLIGALYGAKLLNRNYGIVDKAKNLLYRDVRYKGKELGTVTIFQNDHRIATNVLNKDGSRAIGTRIWAAVGDKVLVQGQTWVDRAFVVHDWYITAYEPIRDAAGRIAGILYVGILEEKYTDLRKQVFLVFTGIVLFGMLGAFTAAYLLSGVILNPIRALMEASRRLAGGDFSSRVKIGSSDELGRLEMTFNSMAETIERNEVVKRQVAERIASVERLAILGRLSAGIAHEINNPLGGILIYGHLLLDDTAMDDPKRANLEKIVRETTRCRDIVKGLLDFARQREIQAEAADLNELIRKTLALVENQATFHNIRLEKDFAPEFPPVRLDCGQIQQVLLNVIINAAKAMESKGGLLKISTRHKKSDGRAEIIVSDTGCGIPAENLRKVFEPFFTTKDAGQGVGLGLAICYGIVEKHGGTITIESETGKGTRVKILLPII